jgi:hypothetical protein
MRKTVLSAFLVFGLALITGCTRKTVVTVNPDADKGLRHFFATCESDLSRAAESIAEQQLIKNLSHLNRMDSGGARYYALERESITYMIHQLSSYTYTECMLVTASGKIIYSMYDNEFIGRTIADYPLSPLPELFATAKSGAIDVNGVAVFPASTGKHGILFAMPVTRNNAVEGVIIASVKAQEIAGSIPKGSHTIDTAGVFSYHPDTALMLTRDPLFLPGQMTRESTAPVQSDGYIYYPFSYRRLSWYLAVESGTIR